jgi:hypothetical protein
MIFLNSFLIGLGLIAGLIVGGLLTAWVCIRVIDWVEDRGWNG